LIAHDIIMRKDRTMARFQAFGTGVARHMCGAAAVWGALCVASPASAGCPDLALVLAIDASGSINAPEFNLQQAGYAAAFRSGAVQDALMAAGRVEIAVVLWGDTEMAAQVLGWQPVHTSADAHNLARQIADMPRRVTGNTGIGKGIWTALDLLSAHDGCGTRRLVNVSGDGKETLLPHPREHVPLATAQTRAIRMGVTINGLAILTDEADLARWYGAHVATGPDAFVMQVAGFDTFSDAIIAKLAREIGPQFVAAAVGLQADPADRSP
jgi:hypothetical protein